MKLSPRTQRIGLLAVLVYIAFIGGATYGTTNLFLRTVQHVLISGLVIAWLVHLIRRGRPLPRTGLDAPLFVYVIWLVVVSVTSHDWRVSLEQSWQMIAHVTGFYMLVYVMQRGQQKWVFEALFLIAALVVLVSAVEIISWYFGLGFAGFSQGWFSIGGWRDPITPYFYRLELALDVSTRLRNFRLFVLALPIARAFSSP